MPKSKRDKVISLSKVKRKTKAEKAQLVEQLQEAASTYLYVYLFEVLNMKNEALKKVRAHWQGKGRFFMGKNKLMSYALGKEPSSEIKPNIYQLTQRISGNACGLFFTDAKPVEVVNYFAEFEEPHFAQSGFVATEDFALAAGPLVDQPFSIETQLRALGLPTRLKDGVVLLESDVSVCKVGDVLTPEQCKVLKLFGQEMAVFKIKVNCVHAGSAVTDLTNPTAQAMQAAAGAAAAAGAGAAGSAFAGLMGAGADEKHKKPALSMSGAAGAAGGAPVIPKSGSAAQMGMQFMLDDGTEVVDWNDGSVAAAAGAGAGKKKGKGKKAAGASAAAAAGAAGMAGDATGMEDDAPAAAAAAKPKRGRRTAQVGANAVSLKDQAQKALSQPLPFAFPGAADAGAAAVAAAPKGLDLKLEKGPRARSKTPTKAAAKAKTAAKKKVNDDGMGTGKMKAAKPKRVKPLLG